MKGIDELIDLTNKSFNCDPWIKEKGLAKFASYLVEESNEAVDAIKNNDNENLKEELGDILSVWLTTCKLANFDKNEIINIAINKIKHRRPYEIGRASCRERV